MQKKILAVCGLICVGVLGRLTPHLPNMTPMTAITLMGSKYVGRWGALLIPLGALILSDIVIGFYDWKILASVYASFLLIGLLGSILKKFGGILPITTLTLLSPFIFFFLTNTAVWAFSPWYAKSIEGLLYCYSLGIPFLRNMIVGDILFVSILFGLIRVMFPKRKTASFALQTTSQIW